MDMNEEIDYIEDNLNKLQYDCFTGTYWLQDEEWAEQESLHQMN